MANLRARAFAGRVRASLRWPLRLVTAAALCSGPLNAAVVNDVIAVSAVVVSSCIVTGNALVFGNYLVTDVAALDQTTTIDVICTNQTAYTVALDAGTGVGATVAARVMTGATDTLTYSLYQDALRTTVWGDTVGVDTVAGVGTSALQSYTVYGRIAAQQAVDAGAYADVVTVTVEF